MENELLPTPPRIAQLADLAAPPLVPLDSRTVPVEPLKAAYPDDWRQAGYQALFSPDKSLLALGVEDDAGYVMQVWLYQPASRRLVAASPRTPRTASARPNPRRSAPKSPVFPKTRTL